MQLRIVSIVHIGVRVVAFTLLIVAAGRSQTQPNYVGSAVCRTCHPNVWANFHRNPHFKSIAAGDLPPEKTGCESCHGPGRAHVESRGGKTTIPRAYSLMPPKRILESCLECHEREFSRSNIRRSAHTLNDVVCTNCHSVHRSTTPKFLLARVQREVCYECHAPLRAQFSMPFKHRVNEGFVQCSDCHNPHGAAAPTWRMASRPRMMEQALSNEEPCLKCHTDKRGPFLFEHAAIRVDGCEICHQPHGSVNARLLRRPVVHTICLECHNGAGDFGRQGDGIPVQSPSHNMADPRFRNCTTCHVRIHGSNADQRFLR
ncbi:MAG TPA: DmsE family decaheme c-type cytochrome [Bryobacteraceae bacterium]|nr:DmsE family decaheme c-type cytochrome [Bryobacteraceae bacterium]